MRRIFTGEFCLKLVIERHTQVTNPMLTVTLGFEATGNLVVEDAEKEYKIGYQR